MAATFTQQEFMDAFNKSGTQGQWSEYDWKNALEDPTWGMSALNSKIKYNNAQTDEERALAHQELEDNRRMKGYSGGSDGSYFHLVETPNSFSFEDAPTWDNSTTVEAQNRYGDVANYGDFTYDPYSGKWDSQIQNMGNELYNYGPFEYSASTDPLYAQYRKEYTREGRRATEDTLGIAAAASGGLPSSYAATAAAQAGNYYASQLTDKIPELYKLAYQKYLSDYQIKNSTLSALQSLDQSDYTKWLDSVNLDKSIYDDKFNRLVTTANMAQNIDNQAWGRYQDNLGQYNTNRSFEYNKWMDDIEYNRQVRMDALNEAEIAYQKGDNSFYEKLGIDTSNDPAARERAWNEALIAADFNDMSWLNEMGVDTSNAPQLIEYQSKLLDQAIAAYYIGDDSLLKKMGIDPSLTDIDKLARAQRGELEENGGLTAEEVMQIQWYMGITMDGYWGPESMTAAGGMTAREAYDAMKAGTLPRGTGGGYYGGGYDGYDGGYQNAVGNTNEDLVLDDGVYRPSEEPTYKVDYSDQSFNPMSLAGGNLKNDVDYGAVRAFVGGTTITPSELSQIKVYFPGVTEADLRANGFTITYNSGNSSGKGSTGTTNNVTVNKSNIRGTK